MLGLAATPASAFPQGSGGLGTGTAAAIIAPGAFGTLELKTNKVHGGQQWRRVLKRISREKSAYKACDKSSSNCHRKVRAWRKSIRSLGKTRGYNLLAAVNSNVNRLVDYRDDIVAYGRQDHWATPMEALTGQGDCEDYAILKYATLRELGIRDSDMRIVVVKDQRRGIGHAVLSVRMNGKTYILDSLRQRPVIDTKLRRYKPYYSVNRQGQWVNVAARKRNTQVASRKTIKVTFSQTRVASIKKPTRVAQAAISQLRGTLVD
jgi:predicted transglutaminase-like cysteine proteinase